MSIEQTLLQRSNSSCELCATDSNLSVYAVPPVSENSADQSVLLCNTCLSQIEAPDTADANHWRCLNDSMWSQIPAVQVMAWRMLTRLSAEGWPQDLLDMLYLEEDVLNWAKSGVEPDEGSNESSISDSPTLDSNGAVLQIGDTVTLIKDLDVKGTGFTAKRGTAVRNISLTSNPEHIEGRVNGVRIVLLTCYLKKSN